MEISGFKVCVVCMLWEVSCRVKLPMRRDDMLLSTTTRHNGKEVVSGLTTALIEKAHLASKSVDKTLTLQVLHVESGRHV